MKKHLTVMFGILTIIFILLLHACAPATPSSQAIETAIAQTQQAIPLTSTPTPTNIPTPTITPTIDPCPHDKAVEFDEQLFTSLKNFNVPMKLLAVSLPSAQITAHSGMLDYYSEIQKIEYPLCGQPVYDAAIKYTDACLAWADVIMSNGSDTEKSAALYEISDSLLVLATTTEKFRKDAGIIKDNN